MDLILNNIYWSNLFESVFCYVFQYMLMIRLLRTECSQKYFEYNSIFRDTTKLRKLFPIWNPAFMVRSPRRKSSKVHPD